MSEAEEAAEHLRKIEEAARLAAEAQAARELSYLRSAEESQEGDK